MNKLIETKLRKLIQKEIKSVLKEVTNESIVKIEDIQDTLELKYPYAWTLYNTVLAANGFKRQFDNLLDIQKNGAAQYTIEARFNFLQKILSQFIQLHGK